MKKATKEIFKNLTFKYTDQEGDVITFSSEQEWLDLLDSSSEDKIVKITITSNKKEKSTETKEGKDSLPDFINQIFGDKEGIQEKMKTLFGDSIQFDFKDLSKQFNFEDLFKQFNIEDYSKNFNFGDLFNQFSNEENKDEKKR